jgi:hypothetical protein
MITPNGEPRATEPRGRPFQFSLRTMFIVTTVVAVLCSGLFAAPGWARILTLLCWASALPAVMAAITIYGRGYLRTFGIGGLFSTGPLLFLNLLVAYYIPATFISPSVWSSLTENDKTRYYAGIFVACYTAFSILLGLVVVGVRWMIESSQRPQPPQKSCDPWQVSPDSAASDLTLKSEDDAA